MLLRVRLDIIQHIFIRHDHTENVYWAEGFAFTSCIFSLSLCIFEAAGISTKGGNGNLDSGHWLCVEYIAHLLDFAHFLLLCRIGDILCQRGACRPLAGLILRPLRRPGRGGRSFSRPPLDDRTTGPPSATSSDRLARVTWPPDHLTSLAPYWPNTWATCYLSWKGSGASQSGSIWSTERDRLVLREVRLLEHLDLNLRLEHFSKQIPPWQSSVRANVLK